MQLPNHGANPHRLYEQLQIPMPALIYDFSENVNPLGLPKWIQAAWPQLIEKVKAYPDPNGEPFLSSVAAYHHISKENVLIGNGAAEIFSFLAERYRGKTALVVHPTFSEYEATLESKGAKIKRIIMSESSGFELPLKEIQAAMEEADVLYLCTPNNPTGILPSAEVLRQLIEHGEKVKCDLVLDEAFIDFVDESLSFIAKVEAHKHLIVVRSMTKMYAIPGIRLGYVVSHPAVIEEIRSFAPHWNVNGIAAEIGSLCFQDHTFVEETKKHSEDERQKIQAFLEEHGCLVLPSVTSYLVFKLANPSHSKAFYEDLLASGIVIRHTENFYGMDGHWFRIGMKTRAQMTYLRKELKRWFAEN